MEVEVGFLLGVEFNGDLACSIAAGSDSVSVGSGVSMDVAILQVGRERFSARHFAIGAVIIVDVAAAVVNGDDCCV